MLRFVRVSSAGGCLQRLREDEMPASVVRLGVLFLLVPICTSRGAGHNGRLRRSLHHALHRHQHTLHGHGERRNERNTRQNTSSRKLRTSNTVSYTHLTLP